MVVVSILHLLTVNFFNMIGEVEEQLVMLERLAPDWICKKAVASGEFLYRQVF